MALLFLEGFVFIDLWNWINQLASTPAGATGLVSAAVALTGSVIAFLRAFIERRSNKLVARDQRRREYLMAQLGPPIAAIDEVMSNYSRLLADLELPDSETVELFRAWQKSYRDWFRTRSIAIVTAFRMPLILQTTNEFAGLLSGLYNQTPKAIHEWIDENDGHVFDAFANFHRAVEHTVFKTSYTWAAWMTMKRVMRRKQRNLQSASTE